MKKKSYKTVRKFLYGTLFALVALTIGIGVAGIIKDRIEYTNTWQYHATYDFEQTTEIGENGEEVTVLNVSTPEQLAGAFNLMEKEEEEEAVNAANKDANSLFSGATTVKLTDNMDFDGHSWTPVELKSGYKIDGQGFSVENINITKATKIDNISYVGFVSVNSGTIKNLNFINVDVNMTKVKSGLTDKHYAGIVAGKNSKTIELVTVSDSCELKGVSVVYASGKDVDVYYGGVAGYNSGTIDCCFTAANVTEGKYAGGIAGYNAKTISNCYNNGSIKSTGDAFKRATVYVGGIAGYSTKAISLSQNNGQITAKAETSNYAGGIVGYAKALVSQCINTENATITSGTTSTEKSYAGGIVGYSYASGVQFSYNRASVSAYAKESSKANTKKYSKPKNDVVLSQFTDDVWTILIYTQWRKHTYLLSYGPKGHTERSTGRSEYTYQAYAGGIIGYSKSKTCKVESCYNLGSVEGGRKEYEDTYAYVLHYEQYHNQASILGYTKYGRHSTRVYYNQIRYTYENYAQPMIGYIAGSGTNEEKMPDAMNYNLGYNGFTTDGTYSCASYGYNYYRQGLSPWSFLGGIGLLALVPTSLALIGIGIISAVTIASLFKKAELKSTPSKTISSASGTKSYTLSGDSKPFDVHASGNKVKNVTQEFNVNTSNGGEMSAKAYLTVNGSKKTAYLSGFTVDNTNSPVKLNQFTPKAADYNKITTSNLKTATALSTLNQVKLDNENVWGFATNKNAGYPHLVNMFW